ncbi:type II toxin-antitoxin system Phd/YefM family antitoxin [Ensifer adhaerens]|uniref:type II toxin-antitoxin system Phd/YefM family antitoxin n=1 Tax=Ensifer adhaerens TaxID=106592 RepID=UPI00098EBB44|nr:type II toxin-antitoxin system Phd/YefM family antitoxin [Ensifer adhaerens]
MGVTTLSSREFNRDVRSAKKAANNGPVIITNRGKPSHVLISYDEFERLSGRHRSLVEALAMPGLSSIDFDPQRAQIMPREVDPCLSDRNNGRIRPDPR